MKTGKSLILFGFVSLAGHALLLAMTFRIGGQTAPPREKVLTDPRLDLKHAAKFPK